MEKEIAEGNIGSVGHYDLEFKGGALSGMADLNHEFAPGITISGAIKLSVSADTVKEAIKKKIPGVVDDAILDIIFAALKA